MSVLLTVTGQQAPDAAVPDEDETTELERRGTGYYGGFFAFLTVLIVLPGIPLILLAWLTLRLTGAGLRLQDASFGGMAMLVLVLSAGCTGFTLVSDRLRLRRRQQSRTP